MTPSLGYILTVATDAIRVKGVDITTLAVGESGWCSEVVGMGNGARCGGPNRRKYIVVSMGRVRRIA